MFYQFRGYLPLIQSSNLISLEHLTFWKLSLTTCCVWIIWWYLYRYRTVIKEKRQRTLLQKINDYKPEPLFTTDLAANKTDDKIETSPIAAKDVDLASNDFLSLRHEKLIKTDTQASILKYGVGSCGPRTFYGTVDIHMALEKALNDWISAGNEESAALLYSYHQCTISSVIAAFCTRESLCFIDEQCGESMEHGMKLKHVENIVKFKHNCRASLKEQFDKYLTNKQEEDEQIDNMRSRFLLVEGLYYKTGSILNVELLQLARDYKVRVILDESLSIGTIGQNGRGIEEYYGLKCRLQFIDITIGSLEHALHSTGGFTLSSIRCSLEQQFLSTGFVYSASLPVLSAQAVLTGLSLIKNRNFASLKQLALEIHSFLIDLDGFTVCSANESPMKVIIANENVKDAYFVEKMYKYCKAEGVFMIFKKNVIESDKGFNDALYIYLKLELLDDNREKIDRFYKVFSEVYKKARNNMLQL